MDNKDEKTFTDLFSSFKDEPEVKTKTFSDILNNSINKEESSTEVTFDGLFEQMNSSEEQQENSNMIFDNDIISNEENNSKIVLSQDSDNFTAKESNETKEITNKLNANENNMNFSFNSFLNLNDSTEEKIINSNETILEDSIIESNPFFEENTTIDEINTNNNPFFKEDINQKIENDIDLNNNPFINMNGSIEENKTESNESILNNSSITINPLFEEKPKIEVSNIEDNPFFSTDNIQSSLIIDEEKNKKEQEVVPHESTSPFFEEEKKNEENPFFQNQLNLVENKLPDNPKGTIDSSKSKHYNVKIVKKKEPLIKLVLGVLSYALFIWLLLIGITLLVYVLDIKIRAAKGDYSSPTFNAYVVLTGSMLPEIEVYDVVVTKKVDGEKLKEGDVITFASTDTRFFDTIITHRIIKKNPPNDTEGYTFQTKGDNNNVADSALVPDSRIFGKVILKIPKLGYLQEFLASRGGWIIVILIPCLTVISYDTVKLIKGLKRKKYKNIKVQK